MWYPNHDADAPYDEGFGFAFLGRRNQIDIRYGDQSEEVLQILRETRFSGAAIARYLRMKFGLKGIREVTEDYTTGVPDADSGGNRGRRLYGMAWTPTDEPWENEEDALAYTDSAVARYRAWMRGDAFGWVLKGPSGAEIESCWGYYDFSQERQYTLEQAQDIAAEDSKARVEAAGLVGAGFIGIV
jgi:hypothetical protein